MRDIVRGMRLGNKRLELTQQFHYLCKKKIKREKNKGVIALLGGLIAYQVKKSKIKIVGRGAILFLSDRINKLDQLDRRDPATR